MNPHLLTVFLLVEAHEHPQGQVEALQAVLTDKVRRCAGDTFDLDRLGDRSDDIASAIVQGPLLDDFAPDRTAFPHWP